MQESQHTTGRQRVGTRVVLLIYFYLCWYHPDSVFSYGLLLRTDHRLPEKHLQSHCTEKPASVIFPNYCKHKDMHLHAHNLKKKKNY